MQDCAKNDSTVNAKAKFCWQSEANKTDSNTIILVPTILDTSPGSKISSKKYLDNDDHDKWKLIFDSELHVLSRVVIFKGNLNKYDLEKYTSDAFSYDNNITSTQNLLVVIGNKPIYYKSRSSKGIQNIRHLMKDAHITCYLSLNSRNASTSKQIFLFIVVWYPA